jgi:hypothetical protein
MRGQSNRTTARRWTTLAGVLVMAVSGQIGLMVAGSAPAAAVPGLVNSDPEVS